ncbi:hypothetical protein ACWGIA_29395, partial [Streptomyces bobili]
MTEVRKREIVTLAQWWAGGRSREPVHEGVAGLERRGLLALVVEGVGAGGDRGRQHRGGGRPVPGDVTGPFGEAGRRFRGAVV